MGTRTFDIILKCGCMVSSDKGGGLIPCCYDNSDEEQVKLCSKSWQEWMDTKDYKKHLQEVQERN